MPDSQRAQQRSQQAQQAEQDLFMLLLGASKSPAAAPTSLTPALVGSYTTLADFLPTYRATWVRKPYFFGSSE